VRSRGTAALLTLSLAIVAAGCGGSSDHAQTRTTSTTSTTRTLAATTVAPTTGAPTTVPAPTIAPTTTPPTVTTVAATPAVAVAVPPPTQASAPTTAPAPLLVNQLAGIGSAQQVIAVAANSYGTSTATVTAYERGANGWTQVFGPWSAYTGRNGVAPAGAKREGDGRTPSGVYGFDFMFGVNANPGVHYSYRRVTGPNIVWDDDSNSPNYNLWIDTNTQSAGANPEPMDNIPSYFYGAVIAYNDARTPGLGSAIFLHVSHGSSTAGCVALPTDELLSLLHWLDPGRSPVIAIGTLSSLTS
jgi:L,D-peptidoglycan transpeptidase YkuD (ErfK/YbiS/YcfS/YnhG family)